MALSQEEKQILDYAKANGKSAIETKTAIAKYRATQGATSTPAPVQEPNKKPFVNKVTDFLGLGGATDVFGRLLARQGIGTDVSKDITQQFIEKPTGGEIAGAVAQTGSVVGGLTFGAPATLAGKVALGAGLGYVYDVGQDLVEKKSATEVLTPGMGTVVGGALPVAFKGAGTAIGALKPTAQKVAQTATQAIPDSTLIQGTKQTATDVVERVPRFVGRVNESVKEQAIKSQRIKTATPAVAEALKAELPESFIQTIPKATPEAKKAMLRVLDIADTPKTTLGQKANPGIVGGELATKQYDVIEKQRKFIGNKIGEATKAMSKTQQVDMTPAYNQLDNLLAEQGIVVKKGVLDFSRSNLAPKQRQVVNDLYKLATEAGDSLSPYEIHKKDQLFSAIQREARADQVADVRVELPDGSTTDLFRAFRDVYSNELDGVAPTIKDLNRQYRNLVTLQDDIDNSIFRTPNFEITKSTDPSEFAKVNLRRIFGEAQSSPVYEAIADEMDVISRKLGYNDASPKEIAAFAQEIRQLYPDTIPKTGSQGILTGVMDVAGRVLGAGKADTRDQQKALRMLLESNATTP